MLPRAAANTEPYLYLDEFCLNVTNIVSGHVHVYVKARSSSPVTYIYADMYTEASSSLQRVGYIGSTEYIYKAGEPETDAYIWIGENWFSSDFSTTGGITSFSSRGSYSVSDVLLKNEQQLQRRPLLTAGSSLSSRR